MAMLTTYQLQGSCSTFLSLPSSRSRVGKVNQLLPTFPQAGRKDRLISLGSRPFSSVGASLPPGPNSKSFKISAFKGNSRYDDSGGRSNVSKSGTKSVKVTYLQHESEEFSVESSNVQNVVPPSYTVEDDRTTRSLAIQNLFKKWLMLLHTPSQTQAVNAAALEKPSPVEKTAEVQHATQNPGQGEVLKAAWCYFLGLDATIKIPLLVFSPLYLGVSSVCGSEVSRELTPLWILGPLIMALYVKMFRAICSLYIFTFEQTVKVICNIPTYALLAHEYIFHGKLKEAMGMHIWQLLADIKNMDYKEAAKRKIKDLQGMLFEYYLDFIESIWPSYNRIFRFLKKANLI